MKKEINKTVSSAFMETMEKLQFINSHKVRKPIATCLGLIQLLDKTPKTSICREELEFIFSSLKPSILELDSYTKELASFISEAALLEKNRCFSATK